MRVGYIIFTGNHFSHKHLGIVDRIYYTCLDALSSPYIHVAIGDPISQVVLSPKPRKNVFWPLNLFMNKYPDIQCGFEIDLCDEYNLADMSDGQYTWVHSLFRWASRGYYDPPHDCVGIILRILRDSGINVPRMPTPNALHKWLLAAAEGFKYVRFDNEPKRSRPNRP